METINTDNIKRFFSLAERTEYRYLMAEMDRMQDKEDLKNGKHVPIPLTVSILSELIYRAEKLSQRKVQND